MAAAKNSRKRTPARSPAPAISASRAGAAAAGARTSPMLVILPQQALEATPAVEQAQDDHLRPGHLEGHRPPPPIAEGAQPRADGIAPRATLGEFGQVKAMLLQAL